MSNRGDPPTSAGSDASATMLSEALLTRCAPVTRLSPLRAIGRDHAVEFSVESEPGPTPWARYEEQVTVPRPGSVALSCDVGLLMLCAEDPDEIQLHYDDTTPRVMLRVESDAIELRDGDLVGVGQRWFRYSAPAEPAVPRLHLLDPGGDSAMSMPLHGESFTVGRTHGDWVLPHEVGIAGTQLQIFFTGNDVFLLNVAGPSFAWLAVPSGDAVPAGSAIAVGDRLVRLRVATPHAA